MEVAFPTLKALHKRLDTFPRGIIDRVEWWSKIGCDKYLYVVVPTKEFLVICASCCSKKFLIYQKRDYHLQKRNVAFNLKVMLLGG